jgi:hypothetical protein
MKTDALIEALVKDLQPTRLGFRREVMLWLLAGAVIAAILFFAAIHVRPDLGAAVASPKLWFKFSVTLPIVAVGVGLALRLATPGASAKAWFYALLAPVVAMLLGVAVECFTHPVAQWLPLLVGRYAVYCVTLIPLLSLGPLACLLIALRHGAPENPGFAGAAAGLLASGVGSSLYALHCVDDSPLFGAAWYTLAIATVTLAGYFAGKRWLRW